MTEMRVAMILDDLKGHIDRIEGRTKRFVAAQGARETPWRLGHGPLDAALPGAALAYDACHDITPLRKTDVPQAAGFILALLKRLPRSGPVIWCQTAFNAREYGRLYPPAFVHGPLGAERFIFVQARREKELSVILEECVRVARVAAVVGEGPAPDFTRSRRLTLAAQESRVPCLILNTSGDVGASAAATRWRVAPIAGPPREDDPQGPGQPAWSLTLARARGGDAAANPTLATPLDLFWNDATHTFNLVSAIRTRQVLAHPPPAPAQRHGA